LSIAFMLYVNLYVHALQVQQLSVKDAGPVVPEDPDPPGED